MKIKKTLAALLAAMTVMAMASCGSSDDSSKEDTKSKADTTAATTAAEESKAEESAAESVAEESTADESAAVESAADESTADESAADDSASNANTGYADGVYTGEKYTIEADPSVWTYGEGAGTDCQFTYAGDLEDDMAVTANFNVVSMSDESLKGTSVSEYAEDMRSAYESTDGYEVTAAEPGTLNGIESYTFTISYKLSDDVTMEIHQVVVNKDDTLVAISYGAADSVMSKLDSEFNKVLDSFKFI
jgi:hypothetical protein